MSKRLPDEADPIVPTPSKGAKQREATVVLDTAGNAIVEMLRNAADKAQEDCARALDSAHRVSRELRVSEDRARTAEAEAAHFRDRVTKVEAEAAHFRDRATKAEAEAAHFRDRATKAEAEVAHFQDRATKAEAWLLRIRTQIDENWLLRIRNEIDENFFQKRELEEPRQQKVPPGPHPPLPPSRGGNPRGGGPNGKS